MTTYVSAVNSVLRRLRETEVTSVQDNSYSKLIGDFVNDAKNIVESSYTWNALSNTLTADTTPDIFSYVLEGSGQRFRVIDVINDTTNINVRNVETTWMNQRFLIANPQKAAPAYYNFNGTNENGDTLVDVYPIPDAAYSIRFNLIIPQVELENDATVIKVPSEPVIFLAYAKALAERGEDGGLGSNESYALFQKSLSDAIALESTRYVEESAWISI
jgi:hypothetical protein